MAAERVLTRAERQAILTDERDRRLAIKVCIWLIVACVIAVSFMTGQDYGYYGAHDRACNLSAIACTKMPMEP